MTRTGVMTGTPGWVGPEHYRTGAAGPEGDVFTWGALVAYAATGRPPFGTGTPDVIAYRVMSDEPDLQRLPDALHEIAGRALSKTPAEQAATVACQTVLTESRARREWIYFLYAVAVLDDDGDAQFLRWGSAGSCDT